MAERLRNLADNNRLPHAIMLCGPKGAGKMALAIALASHLLGTTDQAWHMLNNFQHPDLHFAFPIIRHKGASIDKKFDSDDYMSEWLEMLRADGAYFDLPTWLAKIKVENQQSNIPVAESDRLTRLFLMKSNQGGKKIAIIWLPEKMNIECANKMLKLIEEPPAESLFIMVSNHPEQLLETIRSRVQRFDVKPIAQEDIIDALMNKRGLNQNDATRTARIANGNWLKAISLLEPGNEEALFFDMYVMLMRLAYTRKVSDLKKWSDQCASLGREKQIRMLETFQRLTREYFIYNFHQPSITYMTEEEENFAKKFAPFINENNIIGMYELFQRVIRDIGQNANPKIQFFDLTMKMAVFIHKQK